MPLMEWSSSCSTSIGAIDDGHKQLVRLINDLHDSIERGGGHRALGNTLDELVAYVSCQFRHEEALFLRAQYPAYDEHRQEHEHIASEVMDIVAKFNSGGGGGRFSTPQDHQIFLPKEDAEKLVRVTELDMLAAKQKETLRLGIFRHMEIPLPVDHFIPNMPAAVLDFISSWLYHHSFESDRKFGFYVNLNGIVL